MDERHTPVLVERALELLAPARGGVFVDATVGLGGHAEALLEAGPDVSLVGIDRDPEALEVAARRLAPFGSRVQLVAGDFRHLDEVLQRVGLAPTETVAAVLADLGVSSLQLERAGRGFSFRREGPLDMRMGRRLEGEGDVGLTAGEIVNRYSETDLVRILREYGEERHARRIVRAVLHRREKGTIETTTELRSIVASALPGRFGRGASRIDPATRVFQALRIEVNQELAALEPFLKTSLDLLESGGRLVVISYHSLEDRIVKSTFLRHARGEVDPVTGRPLAETRLIEILTRKPLRPDSREVELNPRSRSARLRAARRL